MGESSTTEYIEPVREFVMSTEMEEKKRRIFSECTTRESVLTKNNNEVANGSRMRYGSWNNLSPYYVFFL